MCIKSYYVSFNKSIQQNASEANRTESAPYEKQQ